jgi:hypothetical protein
MWIPTDSEHWFFLDQNAGREVIIIVASHRKSERLESIVRSTQQAGVQGLLAGNVGTMRFKTTSLNQDGVIMIVFNRTVMVYKRGHVPQR